MLSGTLYRDIIKVSLLIRDFNKDVQLNSKTVMHVFKQ